MKRESLAWLQLPSVWETERLCLRPWREDDAAPLYRWASDPEIGPSAGWLPHRDEADSLQVLRTVLIREDTWAVTLRDGDEPIGSLGAFPTDFSAGGGQPEIGYWLARPFWGRGYIPEAVRALIGLCFAGGAEAVWISHFPENGKSRRVIEKCGFRYVADEGFACADGVTRLARYYVLGREDGT